MRDISLRTSMFTIGACFTLGMAAAAYMGGVTIQPDSTNVAAFSTAGADLRDAYATVNARISAPQEATWDFAPASVTVEVPQPVPIAPRAVASHPVPAAVTGNAVLEEAAKYVGTPYVAGGITPAGFDCSGFVSYVYAQFGISLPHASSAYWDIGTRVSAADAQPGDLIVSSGHVGIFAGDGMQIDAPRAGKTIQFRGIWQTSYVFVRVS